MSCLDRVKKFLNDQGVEYSHSSHPLAYTAREVASAEHLPPRDVAKTVVIFCDDGFQLLVVPANALVDLNEVRANLGLVHARLATEKELEELFPDCELGAMPPLGFLFNLPVVVDRSLSGDSKIAFNAGTHRDMIHMRFEDFKRLTKPVLMNFARELTSHQGAW
jgi:Ala-tRNA(Pro) deacylase